MFGRHVWPLVALGGLVAIAGLAGTGAVNGLQGELVRAVGQDAVGLDAADDLQLQLRHLRVHSLVYVADRTPARRAAVEADLRGVESALATVRRTVAAPEDAGLVDRIVADGTRYTEELGLDHLPPAGGPMADLAHWSDAHHMERLLAACRELADRQRGRMHAGLARGERQTAWAGRVLLGLGLAGVLAGLLSGAATARRLRQQERDLLRAEQLAAVGQLAAGVAHEVRNPLTGVKLLLQAAARPDAPAPLTPDRLNLLLQEVGRIERTVQGLVEFAHTPPPDRRPHDLGEIVRAAVAVTGGRAEAKGVAVRIEDGPDPLPAAVDRDQLLSLLTNLMLNAVEAAPVGSGEVRVTAAADEGGMMRVAVADNGPGVDPAVAGRLFDPFATTKPTGAGLGLAVARRAAEAHGGTLTAAPGPGRGAVFILTLPAGGPPDAKAPGG